MKKLGLSVAMLTALFLAPALAAPTYACSCAPMMPGQAPSAAVAAAVNQANAVFAGRAVAVSLEAITFQVDTIWKGDETAELTLLTGNGRFTDASGRTVMSSSSCAFGASQGTQYIVYAYVSSTGLSSSPCSRTAPFAESEARLLDAVQPPMRIAAEIRPCGGATASAKHSREVRLTIATTSGKPLAGTSATIETDAGRFAAVTDGSGRAVYTDLPAGAYRVTLDREGYAARRSTVTAPAGGCVEASMFLLAAPSVPQR